MTTSYIIHRIVSGSLRFKVSLGQTGDAYLFKRQPSKEVRYIAEELYEECLIDALNIDLMTQAEMLNKLRKLGFWNDAKEHEIKGLEKDIETLKIGLYERKDLSNHDDYTLRTKIKEGYDRIEKLLAQKHSYDFVTAEGYAGICKLRYLIRNSIFTQDGKSEFSPYDTSGLFVMDDYVDKAVECINDMRIEETDYRRVARSNEWQQIWEGSNSAYSLFGIPSCDMSFEQTFLFNWSKLYDSIGRNPDKPRKNIIDDDYKLDGWLILERKKIENTEIGNEYENRMSDKVKNSDEVYVIKQEQDKLEEIDSLNNAHSKFIKQQRMSILKKKGIMNDFEFPDVQQKIQMLQNQAEMRR